MTQTLTQKLVENASNKPGILGTIYEVGAQFLDTISEAGRCWWQLTQAGSEMAQAGYSISKPTLKRRDKITLRFNNLVNALIINQEPVVNIFIYRLQCIISSFCFLVKN